MSRMIVAAEFTWSAYPGPRAGRLYPGKPDLTEHPTAETHVVDGPDADETLCGLPRDGFPFSFPEGTAFNKHAQPCTTCLPEGSG